MEDACPKISTPSLSQDKVHIRGGIGNQVIQSYVGLALAAENNVDKVNFIYNAAICPTKVEISDHTNSCLDQIFDINQQLTIDPHGQEKTPYWFYGVANIISKHLKTIQKQLRLTEYKLKPVEAVVHIRSDDYKKIDNELIYERLIKIALSKHERVLLIGDNQKLIDDFHESFHKLGSYVLQSTSAVNDWRLLLEAQNIYCSPSTFAYSAKLVDITKNIHILSPFDYTNYEHAVNEYIFLTELKKCFGGIYFLDSFTQTSNTEIPDVSFFENIFPSSIGWYLNSKNANLKSINETDKPSLLAIKTLDNLPPDLSNLFKNHNQLDQSAISFNSKYPENIKLYFQFRLQKLNLNNSICKNLTKLLNNIFLSADKHIIPEAYFPIIEEAGFSLTRKFLFNFGYLLSRLEYINRNQSSELKDDLSLFLTHGYLFYPNFLPENFQKEIVEIFSKTHGSPSKNVDSLFFNNYGHTRLADLLLSSRCIELFNVLTGYSKTTIKQELLHNTFMQTINLTPKQSGRDLQQKFHIDTFYPSFKFWYFPQAVETPSAPFEYVPKSHLPNTTLMHYFQERYLDNSYNTNYAISDDHTEGSIRATTSDISRMGFRSKKFYVPANSLVIANVGGFHRRGLTKSQVTRHAIHSSIRPKNIFDLETYSI